MIDTDVVRGIIKNKFETVPGNSQYDDDPLVRGEFELMKELMSTFPQASEAKRKIDIIIDKCGPNPRGTGIQNLRECIIETKWKYDVAAEDKQKAFKAMIINFIERYFYLICFSMYVMENKSMELISSFTEWMEIRQELKAMCENGKDKMEWSRTVDAAKLEKLKAMMLAPNYKEHLPVLIRTIYDFAFITYADLPRGPIKNNSMRKLAASTLMEILPDELFEKINKKIDEDPKASHDFLTIIGLVAFY